MEEVAYVSYYFHWDLDRVMNLEHPDRQQFVEQIASINRRMSEGN
jgi:hypothetical protein